MTKHPRLHFRTAFTLIEMTLASVIVSIVMIGLFSAMTIVSRVAETPYKRSALDLHSALDRLRADAAVATAIPHSSSTAITLTVPDRTGDGAPETIVYDWSQATATTGTISRTFNGTTEAILVVAPTFSVSTDMLTTTTSDVSESAEQLLYTRTPVIPVAYSIKTNQWTGQYVIPALPSNATAWRVTRVAVPARYKGPTNGSVRVQVRSQIGGIPKVVLDEATMLESSLGAAYAKQTFSFTRANNLPPSGGVCVVLQWVADADAAEVEYESLLAVLAAGDRVTSTNSGLTWTANTLQALALDVYGTYSIPAGVTINKLRGLNISMKDDASLSSPITTTIRFPNLPQVSG